MANFNRCILLGNLTRDVELKHTQAGTAVTEISLAINERRKTKDDNYVEETTFVDVTLWGRTAEVAATYAELDFYQSHPLYIVAEDPVVIASVFHPEADKVVRIYRVGQISGNQALYNTTGDLIGVSPDISSPFSPYGGLWFHGFIDALPHAPEAVGAVIDIFQQPIQTGTTGGGTW